MSTILEDILNYYNALCEQGHEKAALAYLDKELEACIHEDTTLLNLELTSLPVHLYSSKALIYTLTLTYYYRSALPGRMDFFERVYNELVFVRGLKDAEDALLVLQ